MQTFELKRTGQRPIRFVGEKLASSSGWTQPEPSRWHELAVYRTDSGGFVVSITLRSRYQGELDQYRVEHSLDAVEMEAILRGYNPCPEGIGYPPGDTYAERHARVHADLRRRYEAQITEIFEALGEAFAEVIQ